MNKRTLNIVTITAFPILISFILLACGKEVAQVSRDNGQKNLGALTATAPVSATCVLSAPAVNPSAQFNVTMAVSISISPANLLLPPGWNGTYPNYTKVFVAQATPGTYPLTAQITVNGTPIPCTGSYTVNAPAAGSTLSPSCSLEVLPVVRPGSLVAVKLIVRNPPDGYQPPLGYIPLTGYLFTYLKSVVAPLSFNTTSTVIESVGSSGSCSATYRTEAPMPPRCSISVPPSVPLVVQGAQVEAVLTIDSFGNGGPVTVTGFNAVNGRWVRNITVSSTGTYVVNGQVSSLSGTGICSNQFTVTSMP